MDYTADIRPISLAECLTADALITTNSVSWITPVTQLGEAPLDSPAGAKWVAALQRAIAEQIA